LRDYSTLHFDMNSSKGTVLWLLLKNKVKYHLIISSLLQLELKIH